MVKVFVSWSGERSSQVAEALSGWIKKVVRPSEVFYSPEVDRGKRWLDEITNFVDQQDVVGIVCVTPENADSRWINFEAGALSRHVGQGRVVPYLFGFKSAGDLGPPLGQFNASLATRGGTWALVQTLNKCLPQPQTDGDLEETFEVWWPRLEQKLDVIPAVAGTAAPVRTESDKVDEILSAVRELSRETADLADLRTFLENRIVVPDWSSQAPIVGPAPAAALPVIEAILHRFVPPEKTVRVEDDDQVIWVSGGGAGSQELSSKTITKIQSEIRRLTGERWDVENVSRRPKGIYAGPPVNTSTDG